MLPPISTTSSHESEVVTLQATDTDDIGQSVLQFVLPPGLPEWDAKPLSLVHFPASSPDRAIEREAASNSVTMTSAPIHNSQDFPGEVASFSEKSNPIGGDARAESIACDLFGSVRGSGDRPGLQTQCGV